MNRVAGILGLTAVGLFAFALAVFSVLNPEFRLLDDYISKLGALGQPYALWWNLIGFVTVGLLFAAFGLTYGRVLQDPPIAILLAFFGVGFAATGVPVDLGDEGAGFSKAHTVAICIGLAAFLFCLARMAHLPSFEKRTRQTANLAAAFIGVSIGGAALKLWSMPVTHRLVFAVVFGWLAATSTRLLREMRSLAPDAEA
jgi:hypothetical membrane protein